MGIYSWDWEGGFGGLELPRTPRLTIRCEYPDGSNPPSEVSFRLCPRYGIHDARVAHEWFLRMRREHEEFEVETDRVGEAVRSETVRAVGAA